MAIDSDLRNRGAALAAPRRVQAQCSSILRATARRTLRRSSRDRGERVNAARLAALRWRCRVVCGGLGVYVNGRL